MLIQPGPLVSWRLAGVSDSPLPAPAHGPGCGWVASDPNAHHVVGVGSGEMRAIARICEEGSMRDRWAQDLLGGGGRGCRWRPRYRGAGTLCVVSGTKCWRGRSSMTLAACGGWRSGALRVSPWRVRRARPMRSGACVPPGTFISASTMVTSVGEIRNEARNQRRGPRPRRPFCGQALRCGDGLPVHQPKGRRSPGSTPAALRPRWDGRGVFFGRSRRWQQRTNVWREVTSPPIYA